MKEYSKRDVYLAVDKQIAIADEKQYFRKAEKLRKWKEWFRGGCIGREPKIKKT